MKRSCETLIRFDSFHITESQSVAAYSIHFSFVFFFHKILSKIPNSIKNYFRGQQKNEKKNKQNWKRHRYETLTCQLSVRIAINSGKKSVTMKFPLKNSLWKCVSPAFYQSWEFQLKILQFFSRKTLRFFTIKKTVNNIAIAKFIVKNEGHWFPL